jgi:hypothetical protein
MKFYVTFGQRYHQEPHPKVKYADPDGWLLIEAADYGEARNKAFEELGPHFATMYDEKTWDPKYFRKGELHRI